MRRRWKRGRKMSKRRRGFGGERGRGEENEEDEKEEVEKEEKVWW